MTKAVTKYPYFHMGGMALTQAVRGGREGLVKMLLEREGIHPKWVTTEDGRTTLLPTSKYRHKRVVIVLAKRAGVDSLLMGFLVFLARTLPETIRNNGRTHYPILCDCPITTKRASYH